MIPIIISENSHESNVSGKRSREYEKRMLSSITSSANYDQSQINKAHRLLTSLTASAMEEETIPLDTIIAIISKMGLEWFCSFKDKEEILQAIHDRRVELETQKTYWKEYLAEHPSEDVPDISNMIIYPNEGGAGACYFVFDQNQIPRYVLKPVDEDIFCMNNHKGYVNVFNDKDFRVRRAIPLYRSAQTDVVVSQIAELIGSGSITPKTWMMIINSRDFYDITDPLTQDEFEKIRMETGDPSKEKLCSIQEFIDGARDLGEVYFDYMAENKPFILDQEDYEMVHLLLWTTFDTDAHIFNLMVYKKGVDESGNIIWGIKKVDNGLAFPEYNIDFRNMLNYFPNANKPMSESLKDKIRNMPKEEIIAKLNEFGMSNCVDAFVERLNLMQDNLDRIDTIEKMNEYMLYLSKQNGTW